MSAGPNSLCENLGTSPLKRKHMLREGTSAPSAPATAEDLRGVILVILAVLISVVALAFSAWDSFQ